MIKKEEFWRIVKGIAKLKVIIGKEKRENSLTRENDFSRQRNIFS